MEEKEKKKSIFGIGDIVGIAAGLAAMHKRHFLHRWVPPLAHRPHPKPQTWHWLCWKPKEDQLWV